MYSDLDLDPTMPNAGLIPRYSYPTACFNFMSVTMCYLVTGSDILYCYKSRKF